ncbi:UNVERIFIED_CONTAM: hypothetical protein GTU68_023847 [Idotea baltica]|nr:hypothetical protein [Idotea baltica]
MAYEIYEANYLEEELLVIGIDERGGFLGEELVRSLHEISPLRVTFVSAILDRAEGIPSIGMDLSIEIEQLENRPIVVVDDVLYSGSTLLNVVAILFQSKPKTIQTAVLIDRGHRMMPISPDFVGLELATTLQQHVSVEIVPKENKAEAYLL